MTQPEKTLKILRLLADGLTIETVALMVGVSERFVKHVQSNSKHMETKQTPMSKRSAESVYLEYLNDWLTVDRMAENYGRTKAEMNKIIDKGREDHLQKFKTQP